MVRALASHARGHRFEPCCLHQSRPKTNSFCENSFRFFLYLFRLICAFLAVKEPLSLWSIFRRFMPRKPLDVRKAYGRLLAYGKQKAPLGRLVLALCLNTVRRRGSRQGERGINSRGLLVFTDKPQLRIRTLRD